MTVPLRIDDLSVHTTAGGRGLFSASLHTVLETQAMVDRHFTRFGASDCEWSLRLTAQRWMTYAEGLDPLLTDRVFDPEKVPNPMGELDALVYMAWFVDCCETLEDRSVQLNSIAYCASEEADQWRRIEDAEASRREQSYNQGR